MEWLKNLVKNLPLDIFSEIIAKLVIWWSGLTSDISADDLPFVAYVGASVVVLALLIFVVRVLPRPIGGIMWVFAVAVLLTPGDTLTGSGQIAPAIAGVAHSVLMGRFSEALVGLMPILAVLTVLLLVGAIWQVLCGMLEAVMLDARKKSKKEPS